MASYVHTDPMTPGLNTVRGDEFGVVLSYTTVASATEERALMLRNASGSGVRGTVLMVKAQLTTSATNTVIVKGYYNPNITATGTSATCTNFNLASSSSTIKSHVSSTGTSTGTKIPFELVLNVSRPVGVYALPIVLNQAQDLLLTVTSSVISAGVNLEVRFEEETVA